MATQSSGHNQTLYYNLATTSRATASMRFTGISAASNCTEGADIGRGTLFMTSDTRALTAYHVIRQDQSVYNVSFESSAGTMWKDTELYTNYPAADEHSTQYRIDREEEFPFLSNRLFSLSLEPWADKSRGLLARDRLREGWLFEIESIPSTDAHHTPNTLWGQGFLPLLPTGPGRDIVLLKARSLDPPAWDSSMLPFPMESPSVFFDQTEVAKSEHGFLRSGHQVQAVYNSPFIDTTFMIPTVALASDFLGSLPNSRKDICTRPGTSVRREFNQVFRTNLDSMSGTSGGAITAQHRMYQADGGGGYRWQQVFGVLQGGISFTPQDPPSDWGPPSSSADFATSFTRIGDSWPLTDRDGPVPYVPAPVYGPDDKSPDCAQETERVEEIDGVRYEGVICTEWKDVGEGIVDQGTTEPEEAPSSNPDPSSPHHSAYFQVKCGAHYPVKVGDKYTFLSDAGAMVGLFGGIHFGLDGENPTPKSLRLRGPSEILSAGGGIGSLLGICAPLSSKPFTSNWRFLKLQGIHIKPEWGSLQGNVYWAPLRQALVTQFEERPSGQEMQARPPSFKTCPPGFFLNGLTLEKNGDYYSAVRSLRCVKANPGINPTNSSAMKTVELVDGSSSSFELFGRPFSLTQMIGLPGLLNGSSNLTDVYCRGFTSAQEAWVIRGLRIKNDNYGRVTYLQPICEPLP